MRFGATGRRMMLLLALVLVVSILSVACGSKTNHAGTGGEGNAVAAQPAGDARGGDTAAELPELSLGLLPSIDAIPFIIAHEQGFDQKRGVYLNIQTFKSAKDRDVAFQAGKVDGLSADLVAISIYNEAGLNVKITSTTFGEFDLLTGNDEIRDVKDLKGKTVILSKNTSTQYTVAMMLKQAGLTEEDIKVTEVPQIPTRLELLKNNKADAAVLPEPFVTMGKASGLRVLSSTNQAQVNPFVLAFPQSAIDAKPEAIRAMYAAYDDAVAYMQTHDQKDYIDLVIKEVGYPETVKDQIEVPAYIPANQVDVKEVEAAFAWAREQGLLSRNLTPEEVISDVQFK